MKKLSEHEEQAIVIGWANVHMKRHPELRWLFAIPNGARVTIGLAVKLKKEGLKKGVCDLFLPVPRNGWHGLFIEMKAEKGVLSAEQKEFIEFAKEQGYKAVVCHGHVEAIDYILDYIQDYQIKGE